MAIDREERLYLKESAWRNKDNREERLVWRDINVNRYLPERWRKIIVYRLFNKSGQTVSNWNLWNKSTV